MITKTQIQEIRDQLNKTENPLIFFDDDPDGICSYILIKKYLGEAKGIMVKSSPELKTEYVRKVKEFQPDLIIVLDKPLISQEFIDKANTPILWIDHHPIVKRNKIKYYNPRLNNKEDNRPTSYWCYKITQKNLWLGMTGTVADWYMPEFAKQFIKEYPKLLKKKCKPEEALYNSKLGELIRIFSFCIKGKTQDTKKAIKVLAKIEHPNQILEQTTPQGKFIYKKANKMTNEYKEILEKAIKHYDKEDKILLFTYSPSNNSFTNEISNELLYKYPKKLIIVAREKNNEMKCSLRSTNYDIPKILEKALINIMGHGGGHKNACGSGILKRDFERFIQNIRNEI